MKNAMLALVAYLGNNTGFTNVVQDRLYPGVAPEQSLYPFCVYVLGSEPLTKDGREYSGALQMFFEADKFTEMIDFADACEAILSEKYNVGTIQTDYVEERALHYTTITFKM